MLNRVIIDDLKSLDPDGSLGLVAELLRTYLEESAADWDKLCKACEAEDRQSARALAHSLKGSSASVGAARMVTWCKQIEAWARQLPDATQVDMEEATVDLKRTHALLREAMG